MAENAYIDFIESHDPTRKTRTWNVVQKQSREPIGEVKFWPAWRKYVFFPGNHMLFDSSCLLAIAAFCKGVTEAWKTQVSNRSSSNA